MADANESGPTPESLAIIRRERLRTMGDQEWALWLHDPVTSAYLQYMDDQIAFFRDSIADMMEQGLFVQGHQHQDRNPDVMRGQIVMLRQLRGLSAEAMRSFYGQESPADTQQE